MNDQQKQETLAAIERMRRRGELSDAEASAKIDQFGLRDAIEPARGVVRESDREITVQLLVSSGVSEVEAWKRVAVNAEAEIAALGEQIDQRRATLQNHADERARRQWEESPEGKRLEAARLADEQAKLLHEAGLAETFIRHKGLADEAMLEGMSPEQKVALAFSSGADTSPVAAAIERRSKYRRTTDDRDHENPAENLKAAGFAQDDREDQ